MLDRTGYSYRNWRELVENTPGLWQEFDYCFVRTFISQRGARHLTIEQAPPWPPDRVLRFSFEASFKVSDPFARADIEAPRILTTYSSHWQSATLSVPVSEGEGTVEGCLEPLHTGNLANLEDLNTSTLFHEQHKKGDYMPRYLAEAFEVAPRLKAFTSGRFWQVDTSRVEMDTYHILRLIRSSLRSASITTISRTGTLRSTPTGLITLPFLKALIHINNHPREEGQIFEYFRLPNLECLTLTDERGVIPITKPS
ncbi:hypothetical protein PQX77_012830 [Marasmius sp. AFHP31]|nr:hypothetical protein PQX77_012830 [Marasmius sp. AFHP31]